MTPGPERSDEFIGDEVREANEKLDFPLLWLGRSYRGFRFNEIRDEIPSTQPYAAAIFYGGCEIPSDQSEGGCALPYELQEQDACENFPVAGTSRPRVAPDGTIIYPEGGGLVVITGRTYVKIFGMGARTAARQLRSLGQDEPTENLEPAAPCVPNLSR